jgi:hypothetical protein
MSFSSRKWRRTRKTADFEHNPPKTVYQQQTPLPPSSFPKDGRLQKKTPQNVCGVFL